MIKPNSLPQNGKMVIVDRPLGDRTSSGSRQSGFIATEPPARQ
jgi:hypothetical protein